MGPNVCVSASLSVGGTRIILSLGLKMIGRRVIYMCILHCVRFLIMEVIVTRLVNDYVMGPVTSWLLGDEGDAESAEGGGIVGREEGSN